MSQQLINRSDDLKRLRDEGYDVDVRDGHLLLRNVPYVNNRREIMLGTLFSELTLAGDRTAQPNDHTVKFDGEPPCDEQGTPLNAIAGNALGEQLQDGSPYNYILSRKPPGGSYADYYEKMTTYVAFLSAPAQSINPDADARGNQQPLSGETESVFRYANNAIFRAGIVDETRKLRRGSVAIVGLGGTGSYILDLVAKTPVPEIHLFDGDQLLQHNVFRAPGALSLAEICAAPNKAYHYRDIYSKMRTNIYTYGAVDQSNVTQLASMGFVFIAVDHGESRGLIVDSLMSFGVPFIDVGMGVVKANGALLGQLRVTRWDPAVNGGNRPDIPVADGDDNEYSLNAQIAELNALNAALAVIRWKKSLGFYTDLQGEFDSCYQIDGNHIVNE